MAKQIGNADINRSVSVTARIPRCTLKALLELADKNPKRDWDDLLHEVIDLGIGRLQIEKQR